MEFDWRLPIHLHGSLTTKEVEESFEDPFAVRLLPDTTRFAVQARFFNLGRAANGIGVFTVYRTNGKQLRVISARAFTTEENYFYQKKLNQSLAGQG